MAEFSLWLNVVGDGPDERPLANSTDPNDILNAVEETADEVDNDGDKYYELNTPDSWCVTFPLSAEIRRYMGKYFE